MKKVISVCLYGSDRRYFNGTIYNAILSKEFFPNWEFRVYHEGGLNKAYLQELSNSGAVLHDMSGVNITPSMWRFYVYDDKEVEYFICRDVDDRLNKHDADIVNIWLESGLPFHIIRSSEGHRTEMMAGMWGGKANYFSDFNMRNEIELFKPEFHNKGEDQNFLREKFFHKIKDISLNHGFDFYNSPNRLDFPRMILTDEVKWAYPVGEVYEADSPRSKYE